VRATQQREVGRRGTVELSEAPDPIGTEPLRATGAGSGGAVELLPVRPALGQESV